VSFFQNFITALSDLEDIHTQPNRSDHRHRNKRATDEHIIQLLMVADYEVYIQ